MTAEPVQQVPRTVEERAHPLTPLVRGWVAVVAVGWAMLQELLPGRNGGAEHLPWWVFVAVILGVALLGLVAGFISWRFTRFIADERELRVESGWVSRRSRRIAYSRLQSVDVMQPLAPRLLGLAEVRIDAGAHDSTKLRYLSRKRAYELRDYLMLRAHGAEVSVDAARARTSNPWFSDLGHTDKVIVTVAPQELLLGAFVSHDLLTLLLGVLVPVFLVWWSAKAFGVEGSQALTVTLFAAVLPLVIAVFQYFSRRVMAQFNFTLAETEAGLRITRGLTNLTSQTVPARRIQSIRITQSLFWRPLKRYRVDLEVLGLGEMTRNESTSKASTLLLPIGSRAQVDAALDAVWPGLRLDALRFTHSPARARLLDPLAYSWNAFGLDDMVVVTRRGWLNREQAIVPHARLQSVGAHQGPVERLMGLANVTFHTTGLLHTHAVIHVDAKLARTLVYDEADRAMTSRDTELLGPVDSEPRGIVGADQSKGQNMWFTKDKLIGADQALAGRGDPVVDPSRPHRVLGTRLDEVPEGDAVAYFALGCFWGAEKLFWQLPGVYTTAVGYQGGFTPNPTYEEVCSGRTGHAETVKVVYDPAKVSYDDLLTVFFENHDPTQGMRQGNDHGTQYRSAIYVTDDAQRVAAEAARDRMQASLSAAGYGRITTDILPAGPFNYAEDYHQQYLDANPNGYCPIHATGVRCN